MSQSPRTDISQSLSTSSARLVAIRLKSANKHIFRAFLSLASANLLIRVMGMLNQVVVTARFGQGEAMDAYFVASGLPILLAQLLASALESSVIPVYARIRSRGKKEQASRLFSTLLNILLIGLALFIAIMFLFRSQLIFLTSPGLDARSHGLAINLAPYIFPVLMLMVLNSFMECLLNTEGQFGLPAYAGILVPLTTATFVGLAGASYGVLMLCVGTLAGQVLQLGAIMIRARRAKFVYRPVLDLRSPEVAAVAMVAWPALFGTLISQASPFVDQIFASTLSKGSISVINNALKLVSVPTGVLFASAGRAALPYLANQAAMKDMRAFKETLRLYLWAVGIVTLGLSVAMIVLSHLIVKILFQHGAFTEEDTNRTAVTLIGFVIGLMPMSIGFITSKAFSALGKSRILLYVTIFSVFANALFDYIFGRIWQSFGIALATSMVYVCTMFILLFTLHGMIGKLSLFTPPREVLSMIWKIGMGQYYIQWVIWREENFSSFRLSYELRQRITRIGIIIAVFAAGTVGAVLNDIYTLRIAFGSIIVLVFLRYHYVLLIVWVLLDVFIGSSLPIFNGANFLSGLTLPTLLLLFYLPTKQAFKQMKALAFLLAYLLWVLVSISISAIGIGQFLTIWTILLDYVGVGVLTILIITSKQRMLRLIDAILLPSTFIALYGIYGYFIKQHGVVDSTTSFFRISSIFSDTPPTLALFLSIIIPLSLYRTFTLQGFKRAGGSILVLLFLVTLGLTFTRGALLSVPLSIIIMIIFLPSSKARNAMFAAIGGAAVLVALAATVGKTPIFSRFFNQDVSTLNGRTYLWSAILDHFDPTQLLGNGLKASDLLLTNLQVGFARGVIATAAHNIFLETLYDHGLIGVTLLALTFITLAVTLLVRMRKATHDHRIMLAMAVAVFFNVLVQSVESNDIWNQTVGIYFWIVMALPFALCWSKQQPSSEIDQEHRDEVAGQRMEATQQVEQKQPAPV